MHYPSFSCRGALVFLEPICWYRLWLLLSLKFVDCSVFWNLIMSTYSDRQIAVGLQEIFLWIHTRHILHGLKSRDFKAFDKFHEQFIQCFSGRHHVYARLVHKVIHAEDLEEIVNSFTVGSVRAIHFTLMPLPLKYDAGANSGGGMELHK